MTQTWKLETKTTPADKLSKEAKKNPSICKNPDGSVTSYRLVNKSTNRATDWTSWKLTAKSWRDMLEAGHYVVSANPTNIAYVD